jgi:hypothetical protein
MVAPSTGAGRVWAKPRHHGKHGLKDRSIMANDRAWILLPSGRRLDLLAPDPDAWTDADLATGLSRTYRWAGYSAWDLPLSVAQHSLTVLALVRASPGPTLSPAEARRELLHDAVEALMGGWDPITPLKPYLGDGFARLVARLQAAIDARYALPAWTPESHARHKRADRLAAASEAHHVAGWSRDAMRDHLRIDLPPAAADPLAVPDGMRPWQPWPPRFAERQFLRALSRLH